MSTLLANAEIQTKLSYLQGWSFQDNHIAKTFILASFPKAIAFVTVTGMLAEVADHHPDMTIQYNRVTIQLSTHSAGGVTQKDFDLAAGIEASLTA